MRSGIGIFLGLMVWASAAAAAPPMQIKFAEAVALPAVAGTN